MDQMVSRCGMRSKESIKTGNEKEHFNLSARACERARDEERTTARDLWIMIHLCCYIQEMFLGQKKKKSNG